MATGRPGQASKAGQDSDPNRRNHLTHSGLASPPLHSGVDPQFPNNPAWQTVNKSLPSLQRSIDPQLDVDHGSPNRFTKHRPFPPKPMELPPLDTGQRHQTQMAGSHFPLKRKRMGVVEGVEREGFSRLQTDGEFAPPPVAESPASRGHPALLGMPKSHSSGPRRGPEPYLPAIARGELAWDSRAEQAPNGKECCRPGCQGPSCTKLRSIVQELVSGIYVRDPLSSTSTAPGRQPTTPTLPDTVDLGTVEALDWAIQRLQWNTMSLKSSMSAPTPEPLSSDRRSPLFRYPPEGTKRQQDEVDKQADVSRRGPTNSSLPFSGPTSTYTSVFDEHIRQTDAMNYSSQLSRHRSSASTSSGPPYTLQQSPLQAPQSALMLPSPASLNLPLPPSFPPVPSTSPSTQNAAYVAHLQDLQHQVSVKTLAHQTLQREYTALLEKLERTRTRTAIMEKKFEVSDAEINSLADEKEKLANQVQTLETQVEELQQARDDARKMGADSAAQYMKIVEMAGRLDNKKGWEKEKEALLGRIRQLESEQSDITQLYKGTGGDRGSSDEAVLKDSQTSHSVQDRLSKAVAPLGSRQQPAGEASEVQDETQTLLKRNETLENALKAAREETQAMRAAAVALAGGGQRIDSIVNKALGDGNTS